MGLRRPYCLRGHRKGYIYTIGKYSGTDSYRKIKDPEFKNMGLVDTWIGACFLHKKRDLKEGKTPCFDEGRMWCCLNDCSVFEAKQHYWKQHKEDFIRTSNFLIKNSNKISKKIKELSKVPPEDLIYKVDELLELKDLIPLGSSDRQYIIDRLMEEGDL